MKTSLIEVTGKSVYPITVAEMKMQLNIGNDETAFDDYLTELIVVVTEILEHDTQLKLTQETWKYTLPTFLSYSEIVIPLSPISSVTHVKYYDTGNTLQTLDSAYYTLDGATGGLPRGNSRIYLNEPYDWPSTYDREDAVQITFVAGYSSLASGVPASLKHALKLLCTFLFEHRGEPVADSVRMYPAYESLIKRFMRSSYP